MQIDRSNSSDIPKPCFRRLLVLTEALLNYLGAGTLFFNCISEAAAGNNKSTHEIYDKALEIANGSFFLRCSARNYPPNPHDLRGSAGREGDFLPRADHPGCPLSRLRGLLQTSRSKAREDASLCAPATQLRKSSFSFYPSAASLTLSLSAVLGNQIKLLAFVQTRVLWHFVASLRRARLPQYL